MKEDDLLAAIRDEAKRERARIAELEAIARGDARAEDAPAESEVERRELEAARPLGADAEGRVADRLLASRSRAPAPRSNVTALRARVLKIAGPLAIAALMVLVFTMRGPRGDDGPELPGYTVAAAGEQAMRGAPEPAAAPRITLRGGASARFEVVARPERASPERVAAFAFVVRGDGVASLDDANVEVSKDGAVRVTGAARELAGATALRVVVGAPRAIGKFDDAVDRARTERSDAHVRVLTVPIDAAQ